MVREVYWFFFYRSQGEGMDSSEDNKDPAIPAAYKIQLCTDGLAFPLVLLACSFSWLASCVCPREQGRAANYSG